MKPKFLITSVVFLLILLGLAYMWPFKKTQPIERTQNHRTQLQTFSCPGMERFTFEYPLFALKNATSGFATVWPMGSNKCIILFNTSDMDDFPSTAPQVVVEKIQKADIMLPGSHAADPPINILPPDVSKNPSGINYAFGQKIVDGTKFPMESKRLYFYLAGFDISIHTENFSEDMGFSENVFFQSVINSFKLTK